MSAYIACTQGAVHVQRIGGGRIAPQMLGGGMRQAGVLAAAWAIGACREVAGGRAA